MLGIRNKQNLISRGQPMVGFPGTSQLATSCHILLEPPPADRQEERIWCIEFFRGKMYDFVADDRELVERLNSFQDELLQSARLGAPLSQRQQSARVPLVPAPRLHSTLTATDP